MKIHLIKALLACAALCLAPSLGTGLGYKGPALPPNISLASAPGAALPRSNPGAQGVSSAAILSFIEAADKSVNSLHSFMMLRHGHVVAEGWWAPYDAKSPHSLYSLSKSFTSTAIGLAIAEGKLSLDDEVLKFFPDDAPAEPGANLKAMRVRDLLRMNTGQETEPPRPQGQSWKKAFLNHPVKFKPGTHFLYNTSATYMLAAIVEKTTGMPLLDYLRPQALRSSRHRESDMGEKSRRNHGRRLWSERSHRGYCAFWTALPSKRQVGRKAVDSSSLGRRGDFISNVERQQSKERLGPGLRLSVLAFTQRRLSRRRRVRPILPGAAAAGRRHRHH